MTQSFSVMLTETESLPSEFIAEIFKNAQEICIVKINNLYCDLLMFSIIQLQISYKNFYETLGHM